MAITAKLTTPDVKDLELDSVDYAFRQSVNPATGKTDGKVIGGDFSFSIDTEKKGGSEAIDKLKSWALDQAKQPDGDITLYDQDSGKKIVEWKFKEGRLINFSMGVSGSARLNCTVHCKEFNGHKNDWK